MTREKAEPGEHRSIRAFTSGYLAVNGVFIAISVGSALVAMGFLFAAGAEGRWSWSVLLAIMLSLLMCANFATTLGRTAAADRRLADTPDPNGDEVVVIALKPKVGGTLVLYSVWSLCGIAVGADVLRRIDRWRVAVDPRRFEVRRGLEFAGAPSSMVEVDQGEQLASIGSWLTALSWCAWIAVMGTMVAAWLWTNRRRLFVWFSEQGIGYLPSRVGDRGYLVWSDVASIEYSALMEGRAFWTTGHEFTIVTTSGEKSVVRMMSGLSVPCTDMASLLNDVAPHVERVGIDPDDDPWGDVVPQRARQ